MHQVGDKSSWEKSMNLNLQPFVWWQFKVTIALNKKVTYDCFSHTHDGCVIKTRAAGNWHVFMKVAKSWDHVITICSLFQPFPICYLLSNLYFLFHCIPLGFEFWSAKTTTNQRAPIQMQLSMNHVWFAQKLQLARWNDPATHANITWVLPKNQNCDWPWRISRAWDGEHKVCIWPLYPKNWAPNTSRVFFSQKRK